jgi:phenylpropionate dioxygenase-like ring-hydroxylating dioxygenase large terminal subunit
MAGLRSDASVIERVFQHIDGGTTDESDATWREPVANYRSEARLAAELALAFRRTPTPFCPSAALAEAGAFVAREAAGTPLLAVRGADGAARVFRNACRHRGAELASGSGCQRGFVCRYHGWSYGLDGRLLHVPHARGFPGLDTEKRGLVPVPSFERHGLVFVTQEGEARPGPELDALAGVLPPTLRVRASYGQEVAANWKVFTEGFLEGYHIRTTHRDTFYPVQYDNLNVVEHFGPNTRIVFPYRAIEKLRGVPAAERSPAGVLTYLYHLFPNVIVATFPKHWIVSVLEPRGVGRTGGSAWALAEEPAGEPAAEAGVARSQSFVIPGAAEDNAMVESIQRSIASGANESFEFGRFEGGITHFHRALRAALGEAG